MQNDIMLRKVNEYIINDTDYINRNIITINLKYPDSLGINSNGHKHITLSSFQKYSVDEYEKPLGKVKLAKIYNKCTGSERFDREIIETLIIRKTFSIQTASTWTGKFTKRK